MADGYRTKHLAQDNLVYFAGLWQRASNWISLTSPLFLVAGCVCWIMGASAFANTPINAPFGFRCAMLASLFFGLTALLYSGMAVACVAHSTQQRLADLEKRLAKLEPQEISLRDTPKQS